MVEDKSVKSSTEGAAAGTPNERETMSTNDDPMGEPSMGEEAETTGNEDEDEEKSTSTPGDEEEVDENEDKTPTPTPTTLPPKAAKATKKNLVKRVMSFDVTDMYPEMNVLTDTKKSEWNYNDPETIRALWLESRTNVLAEWKVKFAVIKKSRKPQLEVRETAAQILRHEYIKTQREKTKFEGERYERIIAKGSVSAKFDQVRLPTNLATEMRYKYIRNNPPVPRYYLEHFDTYRKPPFKLHGAVGNRQSVCRAWHI